MTTKLMSIFLLAVWLALFSVASTSLLHDKRIINGEEAEPLSHPYIVNLQTNCTNCTGGNWYHWCGGVLIDRNWVLTAAHCVQDFFNVDIPKNDLLLKLGEHDLEKYDPMSEFNRSVQYVKKHEDYNPYTFTDDIALIRMDTPVKLDGHVQPATLSQDDSDFVYTNCVLAGWGLHGEGRNHSDRTLSPVLREVNITQIPNKLCIFIINELIKEKQMPSQEEDLLRKQLTIRDSNICLYDFTPSPKGLQSACKGDSGGPMMCGEDHSILAGITSKGWLTCQGINVYTRVSTFYTWIRDTIDEVDKDYN